MSNDSENISELMLVFKYKKINYSSQISDIVIKISNKLRELSLLEIDYIEDMWDIHCKDLHDTVDEDKKQEIFEKIREAKDKWKNIYITGDIDFPEIDPILNRKIKKIASKINTLNMKKNNMMKKDKNMDIQIELLREYEEKNGFIL